MASVEETHELLIIPFPKIIRRYFSQKEELLFCRKDVDHTVLRRSLLFSTPLRYLSQI